MRWGTLKTPPHRTRHVTPFYMQQCSKCRRLFHGHGFPMGLQLWCSLCLFPPKDKRKKAKYEPNPLKLVYTNEEWEQIEEDTDRALKEFERSIPPRISRK